MEIMKLAIHWRNKCLEQFGVLRLIILGLFFLVGFSKCAGKTTLNVTNYGAKGDAVLTWASTVQGSATVTLVASNKLTKNDVGKIIEIFGAGPSTTGTNYQDLIALIQAVTNGTNVTISAPAGQTASNLNCTFGTQNAGAFQKCINAATGTNTDVLVPPGRYLLIPPEVLDPSFVMQSYSDGASAVIIGNGGLRILGTNPSQTILLGNGAWQLRTNYVHRGFIFWINGPIKNTNSLVFENLTMDGGVPQGHQAQTGFVAQAPAAAGWDVTHGAVVEAAPLPLMSDLRFVNCDFVHWRGEMVKSVTTYDSGLILVTNCSFSDGNGSGFNFNWTPHRITGCVFSNLFMAMEYYVGTMQAPSVFENSKLVDLGNAIVLVGGLTNHTSPGYAIQGNQFINVGRGVLMGPACNVSIVGNQFTNATWGICTDGSAYQGNDYNHDITVASNLFNQVYYAFSIGSAGVDRVENMFFSSNVATNCHCFATGYGWSTNIFLSGNVSSNPGNVDGSPLIGQWFLDDPSNQFPIHNDYGYMGITNIISYACGRSHAIYNINGSGITNILYGIDDRTPEQIPAGAQLSLTNINQVPVNIMLSLRSSAAGMVILQPNSLLQLTFKNSGFFLVVPAPPSNLQVNAPPAKN